MKQKDVFDQLEWNDELWTATLSVPYFRGCGERVELTAADRKELPRDGELPLNVEVGDEADERPPSPLQRDAVKKMLARGDDLWDEAMDALCAEYLRQR